jgi:metal-responsive CopG/Arc/MetJ family transcriptional regulator
MVKSSYDNIRRPVRKRSAITGTLVGVRFQEEQLTKLDGWIANQDVAVTRPEAIRSIVDAMLADPSKAKLKTKRVAPRDSR